MPTQELERTIGFKITGEFVTRHARDLWSEDNAEKALHFLSVSFPEMSQEIQLRICCGQAKLEGINDLELVNDNATMHRGEKLLSLEEYMTRQTKKRIYQEEELRVTADLANNNVTYLASPWGRLRVPMCLVMHSSVIFTPYVMNPKYGDWDEFKRRFPGLVCEAEENREERLRAIDRGRVDRKILEDTEPELSDFMKPASLQAAHDAIFNPPTELPPVDRAMKGANGWLSPDGSFYPCEFMGHNAIASLLDKDEEVLEKSWVKIQDSRDTRAPIARAQYDGSDFVHVPDRGVTQSQFNAMERWCERHKRHLPPGLEVR